MLKNYLLLILSMPLIVSAQKKHGYNRIYPSISVMQYHDKNSIVYDGKPPDNYIKAKNTIGHYWGLQFERVTKHSVIFSAGLQYGTRSYDITIQQDLTNFNVDDAANNLKGVIYRDRTTLSVNYFGFRLMSGYGLPIKNKISVVAKGGISLKLDYDGLWEEKSNFVKYKSDTGNVFHSSQITITKKEFGRDPNIVKRGFLGNNRFPSGLYATDIYLGIEKEMNMPLIKNISVGIECINSWTSSEYSHSMIIRSKNTVNETLNSYDRYYDKNLSIGLRVAVGLWK